MRCLALAWAELSSTLGAIITSISVGRFPVIISKGKGNQRRRSKSKSDSASWQCPFDVLCFWLRVDWIKPNDPGQVRAHTHTQFARRQHGVMARSLIIALAHRQRQPERQAGAPLILIEIDSFSVLLGQRELREGERNVQVACHTQLKVKNSEPTCSYLWYLPPLLLPCIDSSCDTVPNIQCR